MNTDRSFEPASDLHVPPQLPLLRGKTVAVFGGAGGWGKKLVEICGAEAARVLVVDPALADGISPEEAWATCDAALISVFPDDKAATVIGQGIGQFKNGTAIVDVAGAKRVVRPSLESAARAGASVCSAHPLVRPNGRTRGHNAPIIPVGENPEKAWDFAQRVFRDLLGMRTSESTFEDHAETLACSQALPHAAMRAMAHALAEEVRLGRTTAEKIRGSASANARICELGLARVAIQPGRVSENLIAEGLRDPAGRALLTKFRDMIDVILRLSSSSPDKLAEIFDRDAQDLDREGVWRKTMERVTDRHVESLLDD